jgi:hypothetical protein
MQPRQRRRDRGEGGALPEANSIPVVTRRCTDIWSGTAISANRLLASMRNAGLALGIIAVESSLPATFLYQRKHRVDRWCCDLDEAAQFLDGGDECIDL